jgi:hypothetical protein
MGQIALIASIVSFAAGAIMLILAGPGFWHRRPIPAARGCLGSFDGSGRD